MATASATNAEVGTVRVAIGEVKVVGVDGMTRTVGVGDKVYAKEVVQTGANSVVQVQLANGNMIDMGRESKMTLEGDLLADTRDTALRPTVDDAARLAAEAKAAQIAALQAKLDAGDISVADELTKLQGTAAGGQPAPGAGVGGDGSGTEPPPNLDQANQIGPVTSGYNTLGVAVTSPDTIPYNLLPPTPSVSVSISVQIGNPPPPPPGTPNDVPLARTDVDAIRAGTFVATGNVITGLGTTSGSAGIDIPGADGVTVTLVTSPSGSPAVVNPGGVITLVGLFGTLNINPDGSYVYDRNPGSPDGVVDKFTYTLTDGTGDTSKADLLIDIGTPVAVPVARTDVDVVAAGSSVATGNVITGAGTTSGVAGADTVGAEGAIVTSVSSPSGNPPSINNGVITIVGQFGTLTLNPNGSYTYNSNPGSEGKVEEFTYTLTDGSGDTSIANLLINIGVPANKPIARTDIDDIPLGNSVATGNVITGSGTTSGGAGADTPGADGAIVTAITGTPISNIGGVITVLGQFGTLTINPDGSYLYNRDPGAPGGVTETFQYTLTDGTGDTSTADLLINIGTPVIPPGDDPSSVMITLEGADVLEGTHPDPKEINFVLKLDHAYTLPVEVTYVINAISANSPADFFGVLTATVTIPAGQTEFIVPVSIVQDHLVEANELFNIVLTHAVNATISPTGGTAQVTIIDDDRPPLARDDSYDVLRGQPTALPSVLTHKDPGETLDDAGDGPFETLALVPNNTVQPNGDFTIITTHGGTVVMHLDGTFVYTPPTIVRGPDTFVYSMTDGYNGTSTATVTLIAPNDPPTVKFDLAPGDALVYEAALAIGSDSASFGEEKKGTFTIGDPDGLADILTVTINGQSVPLNSLPGTVIDTPAGKMTIDSYDPTTGVAGFTYLLEVPVTDIPGQPEQDIFTVIVTDRAGATSGPATLPITIIDDLPTARDDTDSIAAGTFGPETGNVITAAGTTSGLPGVDTPGADTATLVTGVSSPVGQPLVGPNGVITIPGEYGVLTINPNGDYSYARTPGTPGGVTDTFTYTLTDSDGDTSTANLNIDIGDAPVQLKLEGSKVDEAGLPARGGEPAGSDAAANSETTSGVINFNAKDGLQAVTLDGVAVTGTINQAITGDHGTLTVTGFTYDQVTGNGIVTYSYKLTDNTLGDTTTEDFAVVVTDKNGGTSGGTLTIDIIDDVPTARNDTDSVATGSFGPETGNVMTSVGTTSGLPGADTPGADNATLTGVASGNQPGNTPANAGGVLTVNGQYGVLTINPNGDYSYTRNQGTPGGVVDTFRYTLTDSDGDTTAANLTINIGDSLVQLNVPGTQVNEAGLPTGSAALTDSETTNGVFTFKAVDGLQAVTLDGVAVTGTTGQTFLGDHGTLTLTNYNYNPATGEGVVNYSYTLTERTQGDTTTDSFTVVVTELDGDSSSAPLTVNIIDDVPAALNDTDTVGSGSFAPESGNVITAVGTTSAGADTPGADNATVSGISSFGTPNQPVAAGGTTINGQYGVLIIQPNGEYTYTRNTNTPGDVVDVFRYALTDLDGDSVAATLTINIGDGANVMNVPSDEVKEAGLPARPGESAGSDAASNSETTGGALTFKTVDGLGSLTLDGVTINSNGQTIPGDHGTLTVTGFTYDPVSGDGAMTYSYTLTDNTAGDTATDAFAVIVTDKDGDSSNGTLNVNVVDDVPTAHFDLGTVASGQTLTASATQGVQSNDVFGADSKDAAGGVVGVKAGNDTSAPVSTGTGTAIAGALGTLTLSADGSYTYTANPNVNGSDTFVYTIKDGDGDLSTTTLTINVNPIGPLPAAGTVTVDEAALATGSNPGSTNEIGNGNLGLPAGITVVTGAQQDQTGAHGTLHVNADGSFTYTLTSPMHSGAFQGANTVNGVESFTVATTDANGNTSTATITVNVKDDVPSIADNVVPIVAAVEEDGMSGLPDDRSTGNKEPGDINSDDETNSTIAGSLLTLVKTGADTPPTFALKLDANDLPTLFSNGEAVTYATSDTNADNVADTLMATAGGRAVFTLTVNTNGSWAFDLKDQLDHVAEGGENDALRTNVAGTTSAPNIDFSKLIQITDADGDTAEPLGVGNFAIRVQDDIPTMKTNFVPVVAAVDEDGLPTGNADAGRTGETTGTGSAVATGGAGALSGLVSVGADEEPSFGLNAVATPVNSGLDSKGADVLIVSDGTTLHGYVDVDGVAGFGAGDRDVFTLTVGADGSYRFELKDQIDHATGAGENLLTNALDLSGFIKATDKDGDTLPGLAAGAFAVQVRDDIPTMKTNFVPVVAAVDEDGLPTANADAGRTGETTGTGSAVATGGAGALSGLVSVGADEEPRFGLNVVATPVNSGLDSKGADVLIVSDGTTLHGYVDVDGVAGFGGADRDVFTLTVGTDGSYRFELKDQIDHATGAGENLLTNALDLSDFIKATDKDGDTLPGLAAGAFAVQVRDDIPTRAPGAAPVTATVEEDGMAGAATGDLSTGNKAAAGDSNSDDEASGAAGSLTALFSVGADEALTTSLSGDTSGLPALLSKGEAVTYTVNAANDLLTATAGGRMVFTLSVGANGGWAFDLKDQLDHVAGGNENSALRTVGGGSVTGLDFSGLIIGTDADGDTVKPLLAGDFAITVQDDIPVANLGNVTGNVDEDGLDNHSVDASRPTEVNGGGALTATGSVASLVSVGADEPGAFSLNSALTSAQIKAAIGQTLTSDGTELTYSILGSTVTAKAGAADVFTLTVDSEGAYNFTLTAHLDHPTLNATPAGSNGEFDNAENALNINFGGLLTYTDKDGDKITLGGTTGASLNIKVQDDIPIAVDITKSTTADASAITNLTLIFDVSGSMGTLTTVAKPNGGFYTRLEMEQISAQSLINEYAALGSVKVTVVTFSTGLGVATYWQDAGSAISTINGLTASGYTNYDAGIAAAKLGYNTTNMTGLLPNAKDVLYFLSDGMPNKPYGSAGMSGTEETAWQNFLKGDAAAGNNAGEEITAYSLGMGPDVNAAALNPIAYNGVTSVDTNAIIVSDFSQLTQTLLSTVQAPPVIGSLLTDPNPDAGFGADNGWVQVLTVDGQTYIYDQKTDTATGPTVTGQFDTLTNQWTVTTSNNGTIVVDMDDGVYVYTPPVNPTGATVETIGFTLTDRDGDTANANLTVNVIAPVLVVGQNVNDQTGQATPHKVDPAGAVTGEIAGSSASDMLIGDIGGGQLQGKNTNVILMLDTSGSMMEQFGTGGLTRLAGLQAGVLDALTALANSGAENVRVHMNDFATGLKGSGTFNLVENGAVDTAQLAAATTYVNGLNTNDNGWTNYEASLNDALGWVNGTNNLLTGADVINQAVFVSDGGPNTALTGNSNNASAGGGLNAEEAMQHLTGTATAATNNPAGIDTVSEIGEIERLFGQIQAIGMGLPEDDPLVPFEPIDVMTAVEGAPTFTDPGATNTLNPLELKNTLLTSLTSNVTLSAVGNDVLTGGAGNDILYGDTVNTDVLGAARALGLPTGAGWEVFERLETGSSGWTRADTLNYIRTHSAELAVESVGTGGATRAGGHDTLTAGAGNDTVYGQEGNDIIIGGAGNDILNGGSGADTFVFNNADKGSAALPAVDTIRDFNPDTATANKDVLNLSDLLQGENAGNLSSYLTFAQTGADVTLSVQSTGIAGQMDQKIVLQGVTMAQLAGSNPADSAGVIANLLANNKLLTD